MLYGKHVRSLLAAVVVLGVAFGLHRAAASQGERREGRERWEHCAVVVSSSVVIEGEKRTGRAFICQFRGAASRCEEVSVPLTPGRRADSWDAGKLQVASSVISRLGSEGWELVGQGEAETFGLTGEGAALYFKRASE